MKFLSQIGRNDLSKEVALVRVDLNVEKIENSLRLKSVIPTIKFLRDRGASVLLLSHRGRPNGIDLGLSLEEYTKYISEKMGEPVDFFRNFSLITDSRLALLENLRFDPREDNNDLSFAKELAGLGTMYVNDAFAVSHRANASISALAGLLPSYAGLLFEKEYSALSKVMNNPPRPLIFIIGGAKTKDKLSVIKYFWDKADAFLLGGGPANTILKAKGVDVQDSLFDASLLEEAKELLKSDKIVTPQDWVVDMRRISDIGPSSIRRFAEYINQAKTIVWSGPLGHFEDPKFKIGSEGVARAISESNAFTVVGGGETTELVMALGLENKISFLSTAGGAMLEFLAGNKLPGVAALE